MKLIVGLGNPGKKYASTRHNAGFLCIDLLREKIEFPEFRVHNKFNAEISQGEFNGEKMALIKPQTFMNVSGEAVSKLFNFYNCSPADLIVIYDDIDLALGKIRIRKDGSAGSHNGMKSVIQSLGLSNFPRIRIGIESRGADVSSGEDIASFVLHPLKKNELPIFEKVLSQATEAVILTLSKGIEEAMQVYN